jgi:hypothetical protein
MVKYLSFKEFVTEAMISGQMMPNINFAPNIAFVPMAENPTPDPGEQEQLNLKVKSRKSIKRKKDEKG